MKRYEANGIVYSKREWRWHCAGLYMASFLAGWVLILMLVFVR